MRTISKVAVLGSGVMGGGIAAHLANCGIPSLMLDIVPPNLSDDEKKNPQKRNGFAAASKAALFKSRPASFSVKSNADLIEIGNFEDDMAKIADCDWIIEVVTERLEIKKIVFEQVKAHRTPGTILSSNTSGIPIKSMVEDMNDDMKKHFLGTHFFNPPRYLNLLEIIPAPDTDAAVIEFMAGFFEDTLGKGVVYAKDTPNFVANRIMTFSSQYIAHGMLKDGLTIEEVDALTGPVIGHASSATFRTGDLVGLDTMINVVGNVANNCPDDERLDVMAIPDFLNGMLEKGYLGLKSGSGFYRKTKRRDERGKTVIETLDLETLEYRDPIRPNFDSLKAAKQAETLDEKLNILLKGEDKGAVFSWKLFANSVIYAANRIPEAADDIVNIDNACRWGFAWDIGMFETWDTLGFDYVCDRMEADGLTLPAIAVAMKEAGVSSFYTWTNGVKQYFDVASKSYQDVAQNPNNVSIVGLKKNNKVVKENGSCTLLDLGDGILGAEFHTKMNSIDDDMGAMLVQATEMLEKDEFDGLVIGNQGEHFCAGANVFVILGEAMQGNWDKIDAAINELQQGLLGLRLMSKPVVAAPHHYTLGGGCEIAMHADRCVINGETYGGLVEVGVGLVPGGGGCKEMLRRAQEYVPANIPDGDLFPYVRRAFENIAMAKVSTSGAEFIELGYMTTNDIVTPSFNQQIKLAKDVCLGMIQAGYKAPRQATMTALGETARAGFRVALQGMHRSGFASEHDVLISEKIGYILTGGDRTPGSIVTEQDILDLEREAFLSLLGTEKTQERIQHMLMKGKPLRN
jgi:3-hydroxyacyl-CoA dehydrogenase